MFNKKKLEKNLSSSVTRSDQDWEWGQSSTGKAVRNQIDRIKEQTSPLKVRNNARVEYQVKKQEPILFLNKKKKRLEPAGKDSKKKIKLRTI